MAISGNPHLKFFLNYIQINLRLLFPYTALQSRPVLPVCVGLRVFSVRTQLVVYVNHTNRIFFPAQKWHLSMSVPISWFHAFQWLHDNSSLSKWNFVKNLYQPYVATNEWKFYPWPSLTQTMVFGVRKSSIQLSRGRYSPDTWIDWHRRPHMSSRHQTHLPPEKDTQVVFLEREREGTRQRSSTTFSCSSLHQEKRAIPIYRVTEATTGRACKQALQTMSAVLHSCCVPYPEKWKWKYVKYTGLDSWKNNLRPLNFHRQTKTIKKSFAAERGKDWKGWDQHRRKAPCLPAGRMLRAVADRGRTAFPVSLRVLLENKA